MNNVKSIINIGFISIYGRTIDIIADIYGSLKLKTLKCSWWEIRTLGLFWLMHTKFNHLVSSDIHQYNSYLRIRRCVTILLVTI